MCDYTIRSAKPENCDSVLDFLKSVYYAQFADRFPYHVMEDAVPRLINASVLEPGSAPNFQIATLNGRLIACGGWSFDAPLSDEMLPGLGHIRFFGTCPDYNRKGVARMIFSICASEAYCMGIEQFDCLAPLPSARLYRSLGFERVGSSSCGLDNGLSFPLVRMRHVLAQSGRSTADG